MPNKPIPSWLFPGDERPAAEIDDEVAEELRLHLDLLAEEHERRGVTPGEAKQQAAERFGDFGAILRRCRREKQGNAPMIKQLQLGLTVLVLVAAIGVGWQQWRIASSVDDAMRQINGFSTTLSDISDKLAKSPGLPVRPVYESRVGPDGRPQTVVRWVEGSPGEFRPSNEPASPANEFLTPRKVGVPLHTGADGKWSPGDDADPQAIREQARRDADAGRYQVALEKHLWYFENAERLRPSLSAVRTSFALSDWYELACEYPPAMEEMRRVRDKLEERVLAGEDISDGYSDLVALNRTLGEEARTVAAFRALDEKNKKAARRAIHYSKKALVANDEYELLSKYVAGEPDYQRLVLSFDAMARNDSYAGRAESYFRRQSADLVAYLVRCNRHGEAQGIATKARQRLDDADFHGELDAALKGEFPQPEYSQEIKSLAARGDLTGTVTGADGEPIAKADVLLIVKTWPNNRYRQDDYALKTDEEGRFTLKGKLPLGAQYGFNAAVVAEGHALASTYVLVEEPAGKKPAQLAFALQPSKKVKLVVRDAQGKTLPNTQVAPSGRVGESDDDEANLYFQGSKPAWVKTDDNGAAELDWFRDGDIAQVYVRPRGGEWQEKKFEVAAGKSEYELNVEP